MAKFHFCAKLTTIPVKEVYVSDIPNKGDFVYKGRAPILLTEIWPKRIKRSNGTVLTPDMEVTVTTLQHTTTPFYNGAKELQEVYMRIYAFDYKKACCYPSDFEFRKLD